MKLLLAFLFVFHLGQDPVYVCTGNSSKRYHRTESCNGLQACRAEILSVTLSKAEGMRRTPCQICTTASAAPARIVDRPMPASSGQCSATTKKGSQCSRAARSGGYCWQHGG
ncbi:MAG: hypothetical protein EOO16_06415 [Chitinophagaceae bacterium]|nr:MAG: hypothetical protein EOO16_06415 [Chitinophagaceae bacterium]